MRTCYHDLELNSIADLTEPGVLPAPLDDGWMICRINVPARHRGQGHGSALLNRIIADADAAQVPLYLLPVPSGPLNRKALIAWYQRHGFVVRRDAVGPYMAREPRAA